MAEVEQLKNQLQAENLHIEEEVKLSHNFGGIVGKSAALKKALHLAERVAGTGATILILGETGTSARKTSPC